MVCLELQLADTPEQTRQTKFRIFAPEKREVSMQKKNKQQKTTEEQNTRYGVVVKNNTQNTKSATPKFVVTYMATQRT